MGKTIKMEDETIRKRGRPAGKGRIPLSVEERRARNALYERERRIETAEAMAALAEAAGCDPGITNAELLATVVNFLSRAQNIDPTDDVLSLRTNNENLMQQIQCLEARLGSDPAMPGILDETNDENLMRTHANTAGCKKIKLESSRGKQRTRRVKKEHVSPVPNEVKLEVWPVKLELSPMQEYEIPSPPITDYATVTGILDNTEALSSDTGDLGNFEASWSGEQIDQEMQADDGVNWMSNWSVEDFALEFLL